MQDRIVNLKNLIKIIYKSALSYNLKSILKWSDFYPF